VSHNRYERAFMRLTERFQLNPSDWLPTVKPDGVYEMGRSFDPAEGLFDEEGNLREGRPVPIESFSIWGVFWTICFNRRKKTGHAPSRWEELWSFLSDVTLGVYDTTNWVPVEPPEGTR